MRKIWDQHVSTVPWDSLIVDRWHMSRVDESEFRAFIDARNARLAFPICIHDEIVACFHANNTPDRAPIAIQVVAVPSHYFIDPQERIQP